MQCLVKIRVSTNKTYYDEKDRPDSINIFFSN